MNLSFYDVIFLAVAIGVVLWQIRGITVAKQDMLYEGKQLGRKWTMLIAFAVLILAAVNRGVENLMQTWSIFVAVAVVIFVYCFTKIGFGNCGVYRNSACYRYDSLRYYEVYTYRPETPIIRVGTDFREVSVVVKAEEKDEIVRFLESKGVHEVALYRRNMRKDAEKMEARRQQRKENRAQAKKTGK